MRAATIMIAAGSLVVGMLVIRQFSGQTRETCRSRSIASVTSPDGEYIARADIRKCDGAHLSGFFVLVQESKDPRVLHEVFYSSREVKLASLTWTTDRRLQVKLPGVLTSEERQYDGLLRTSRVTLSVIGTEAKPETAGS